MLRMMVRHHGSIIVEGLEDGKSYSVAVFEIATGEYIDRCSCLGCELT